MRSSIVIYLLILLCLISVGKAEESLEKGLSKNFSKILDSNCRKCHGGKDTEGNIDLVDMLSRNMSFDDVSLWSKVYSEVQSGNMPPDDEEEPLTAKEKADVLSYLELKLGEKESGRSSRMITPDEYKNSIADLFQLDHKNYDPIGDLYAFVSPDHKFLTVDSHRMMNRFYFTAMMNGTEKILKEYHADHLPPIGRKRDQELSKRTKERLKEIVGYVKEAERLNKDKSASDEERKKANAKAYEQLQGILEGQIARVTPKSKNYTQVFKFPMKMSPRIKDTTDGFFEYSKDYWGIRGKSWEGNHNMPIMLLGGYGQQFRIFPPGKYRLTIKASAVNRKNISTVPHVQGEENAWSNNRRLESELCKLMIFKDAHRTKTKSDPLTKATPIGSFHIEDDKVKDYTIDVAFHWNTQLGVLFENGVANVLKAKGKQPIMSYDNNGKIVYVKDERKLPAVHIYDITIDKIGEVEMGPLYIKDMKSFDEKAAKKKIATLAGLAKLEDASKYFSFFDSLHKSGRTVFDAYTDTAKWMFSTSDFLYVDRNSKSNAGQLRYASYSLLKTLPTEQFSKSFNRLRSGETSPEDFTDELVKNKNFGKFIESFSTQWLHYSAINENAPDRGKFSAFYDDELKGEFINETSEYIKYLFTDNRPLRELVDSDYYFINDKLAVLYGIKDIKNYDVKRVQVKSKDKNRLGILSHAGFMVATSNGVEDLPFRRSEWISENILDKKIPPPPNEVDVTAFGRAEKQDFASRIKAHISNEACNSCHRLLDPVAIDIHMFDVLGHLKKDEISAKDIKKHLASMEAKVTSSKRRLASAFTKKLITFINGKTLGINDLLIVSKILKDTKGEGYKARDILTKIIENYFK